MLLGSPAVVGYTYSWSPITDLDNAGIAQPTATVNGTITYTLTVTTPNGCTFMEAATLTATGSFTVIAADTSVCENGSVSLSASVAGVDPSTLSFSWLPTTGLSNPNISNPTVSGLAATTVYTVTTQ